MTIFVPYWVLFVVAPLALLLVASWVLGRLEAIRCLQCCYWEMRMRLLQASEIAIDVAKRGDGKLARDVMWDEDQAMLSRHKKMVADFGLTKPNGEHAYYPAELRHSVPVLRI